MAPSGRKTHAEIARLIPRDDEYSSGLLQDYLQEMASAFSVDEVLGVMALVDTPDVFD